MRKFKFFLVVFVLLIAGMSVGAQNADTPELREVQFFLSYIPNIQFSPIYLAIEKGYFAEEGIDLILEHGDENIGVEQIAVGTIPFGMISGEQVILARANARPVVFTYQWFQAYPIAVVIPNTTDATTIAELSGLNVGVPGRFGANYSGLTAILNANGMTEADINLTEIGFNAPDVICAGAIDAATVYINNEPLQIQHRADAGECGDVTSVTVIPVADSANMVSNGIVTNEEMIANDPELVAAVVRAFDRGLRDAINNPAEAYLSSVPYVENLPLGDELQARLETLSTEQTDFLGADEPPTREAIAGNREAQFLLLSDEFDLTELTQYEVLLETIVLWDAENLGVTQPEDWELTQAVLLQMNAIPAEIVLEDAYTTAFLPPTEE
ncbi:MAG: ABC transporter substrate-binding protein [Anaerolineae bacterium]|jgi:NitT/TauT family transport system substrate-binding protein|nr:ABC transporter substrate-binding protein [Anaerolineae bacterium]